MEQNIPNNQEKKNEKNNTGLIIAIIAAVTVVLIIAIVIAGKSIANKKVAEIQEKVEIVEQIEPEDNTEADEAEIEDAEIEEVEIEEAGEVSEKQVEENQTPEEIAEAGEVSKAIKEATSAENSDLKKMTDDEYTLCWYNDKYLNYIPLMGLGTYETILQKDNFSTGIISGLTKDDIKVYCEHKGAEGDLDLCGFTKDAKVTSDKENVYSYQVSNKDGITVYISWADGVAAFTVGEE